MRDELMDFQQVAVNRLLGHIGSARERYLQKGEQQVIAFRAPTGSGKTIVMTSVIEEILNGSETPIEQPEAIFVWLSDSPQLNEQSKLKVMTRSTGINASQCITINDETFDQEVLDDGKIYFLNTQKLGQSSRLVSPSESRTYTIWQTLMNTKERKCDRLYVIIDEAHRGMRDNNDAKRATSIMQKFLKGAENGEMEPMPIVIGMSATDERFLQLVKNIDLNYQQVVVSPEDVRSSGLLKDRIIITYPGQGEVDDIAILQAASDEWKHKCEHWERYCQKQKIRPVKPVLVVQVENRSDNSSASATELGECVSCIVERTGYRLEEYEVVHTFGQMGTIEVHGLKIHHVEASDIADDERIRVVFFKENLSTGWDCPRAETMMSFRHAQDVTYIAQLLGRMIRTPLQRRIDGDETLNEVRLFLPHFNRENVDMVINALQDEEGGKISTDIERESYGSSVREELGVTLMSSEQRTLEFELEDRQSEQMGDDAAVDAEGDMQRAPQDFSPQADSDQARPAGYVQHRPAAAGGQSLLEQQRINYGRSINREEVRRFINQLALKRYEIKQYQTTDYLHSLDKLSSLVQLANFDQQARQKVLDAGVKMIEEYVEKLKAYGEYEERAQKVREFDLSEKAFDVFGKDVNWYWVRKTYTSSAEVLASKFRSAEKKLGGMGIGNAYGRMEIQRRPIGAYQIPVILFAQDQDNIARLYRYAEEKFHEMGDEYRLRFSKLEQEDMRSQYDAIISRGNAVSTHTFTLPEFVSQKVDSSGQRYYNHLYVNKKTGYVQIMLDAWEEAVIEEESHREDFVCWLRNPPYGWGLCLKREEKGVVKGFYPDFLIVRKTPETGYVLDILEPHRPDLTDNLSKAKALVDYLECQPLVTIGRLQLIREAPDRLIGRRRMKRLDLAKSAVRERVMRLQTNQELDNLFLDDSLVD